MIITDRDPEFKDTTLALYAEECGRTPDRVSAKELAEWMQHFREGMTGDQARVLFHDSPEGVAYRATPPPPTVPPIRRRDLAMAGRWFTDYGSKVHLAAIDQFRAYDRYLNGEDLTPLIEESHDLGAWAWRTFLMADSFMQLGPTRSGYYDRLPAFTALLADNGLVLNPVVLADAQVVLPRQSDQHAHAERVYAALRGFPVLVSLVNEFAKNGVNPAQFPQPPDLLWSRGSNLGDAEPPQPFASFIEFHPRRDIPKTIDDAVASANYLRYQLFATMPIVIDEPLGFAAVNEPGRRSNDPEVAGLLAGLYKLMVAGSCFHSSNGIQSVLLDPPTRRCAEAWFGAL